ncbi:TetR/AcrR family transcriptional regulator [Streptomyces armeniacus]|uniref:TetR/AcrR family transcriptional regulator n=1 Tax=Streptomyces armeniacus TaxID=83291 RepID=A0A345XNF3_9ACTN|nr:TetR/AcrR family transcriptional regulator [Streptomyces armeniacus]AXK33169.1 TetR/AcrR family transcriptional regulator [Streptomyces armeniacus]
MDDERGTTLPPGLARAWGLREGTRKGPRPGLTTDRIVSTGIALAAAEGLTAVSMGRVAAELGVSTMSLYRYVGSKDELLILMEDAAYGTPPEGPPPEDGWRPALTAWAAELRAASHRNLWALRIPITTPPATPHSVAWMERGLACMRGTGLDPGEKLGVIMLLSSFVRQEARLMSDLDAAARADGSSLQEATAAYGRLLGELTDAQRFPEITAVLRSGVIDEPGDPDDDFGFGLNTLLDGVAVLVAAREPR